MRFLVIAAALLLVNGAFARDAMPRSPIQSVDCSGTVSCVQQGGSVKIVGSAGSVGPQGVQGVQGMQGSQGVQGIAGTISAGVLPPGACLTGDSRYQMDATTTQFRIYLCSPANLAVRSAWMPLDHTEGY